MTIYYEQPVQHGVLAGSPRHAVYAPYAEDGAGVLEVSVGSSPAARRCGRQTSVRSVEEEVVEYEDLKHPDRPFPRPAEASDIPIDELVDRVKRGQRASAEWKARWWTWCDVNGGTRDPAKLSYWELCMAVSQCGEPPIGPYPTASASPKRSQRTFSPPQLSADSPFHADLVHRIKAGQKVCESWKAKWWQWCDTAMNSTYDPSRHPLDQLLLAMKHIGFPPEPAQPVETAAVDTTQLVDRIKTLQRADPAFKTAWGEYCELHGKGRRDPSKHTQAFLSAALEALGQSHLQQ